MSDKAAIDWQGDTEDETGAGAAQPQDRRGYFIDAAHATDRLFLEEALHGFRIDLVTHGRVDAARADGVDADAQRGVVHGGALGQTDDAVLAGMVGRTVRQTDYAAQRGAVDDRAIALFAQPCRDRGQGDAP